ncbi:AAA family ATPase [Methylobacterium fujisawaense]
MNPHARNVRTAAAVAFLQRLDLTGRHHLTALDPETGEIESRNFAPGSWVDIAAWIEARAHLNLYYSVNEPFPDAPHSKLRKEHIARIRAIVADLDLEGGTAGEVREQRAGLLALAKELSEGEHPPSYTVDSGNGVQLVWPLAVKLEAKVYRIDAEDLGAGIAHQLDGDNVQNIDRIMRLPGSYNHSAPKKRARGLEGGPVRILEAYSNPDAVYTIEDLEQSYEPIAGADQKDRDAAVQAAMDEVDWNTAEAGVSEALAARLRAAAEVDPYFKGLLAGSLPRAPGDGSGSDWRAALAGAMARKGFGLNDYAAAAYAYPPGQPRDGGPVTLRMVARDWARVGTAALAAAPKAETLFAPIEAEPDTSSFPAPVPESYDLVETPAPPVEIEWINPADWHGFEPQEKVWYVPGLIPHNEVTMLTGKGGIGKSLLALQALICIALGLPFFGRPTKRARVVGFFCEDDPDVLHRRTKDICAALGVDVRELDGWMRLASRKYADNLLAAYEGARGGPMMKRTAVFDKLEAFCVEFGAEVALLDTIADVFGGNEIDRQQVRQFVQGCAGRLAGALGACIIVGHPSKSGQAEGGDGTSGSTAWHGSVRSRLYLEEAGEKGSGYVKLTLMKSNYGPSGESWIMRYRAGVLDVVSASEPTQGVPETTSLIHSVVLAAISKARAADVRLVMAANSPHNAAKVLRRRDADALKPYSKHQLDEALSQLVALGVVAEEMVGYDKTRNPLKSLVVRGVADEMSDTTIPVSDPEGGLFD